MKNILVPVDFSDISEYAAKTACEIAKANNSTLYLLHVVELPTNVSPHNPFMEYFDTEEGLRILNAIKNQFEEFLQKPFFKGVKVVEALQFDGVYESIIKNAKKHNIDLIVMGSKGHDTIDDFVLGSNTEKIIRRSECPVLVLKNKVEHFNPKNVVFASYFDEEAYPNFDKILDVLKPYNYTLHLLKIVTPHTFESMEESHERLSEFQSKWKLDNAQQHIYNDYTVEEGVAAFCKEIDADLLVMETHGRKGLSHILYGSIAESTFELVDIPVLSIRIKEES
jgi:nucleotide-binding universal stress UspA family protein